MIVGGPQLSGAPNLQKYRLFLYFASFIFFFHWQGLNILSIYYHNGMFIHLLVLQFWGFSL